MPLSPSTVMTRLSAVWRLRIRPVDFSTVSASGVTNPPTTASPKPQAALIRAWSRLPVTGLAVNSTPERSARTKVWTTTATSWAARMPLA